MIALGTIRLSAVFFYCKMFCSTRMNDLFGVASMVMIVVIGIWILGLFIGVFFLCGSTVNDIFQTNQACLNNVTYLYALAYSSITLDFLVIVLPIPKELQNLALKAQRLTAVQVWYLSTSTTREISITVISLLAGA